MLSPTSILASIRRLICTLVLLVARRLIHLVCVAEALTILLRQGFGLLRLLFWLLERLQVGRDVERLSAALLLLAKRDLMIEMIQEELRVLEDRLRVVRVERRSGRNVTARCSLLRLNHGLVVREGRQLMVVIIAIELLLDLAVSQARRMLLELWVVEVLPFFIDVVLVEVVFCGRNEGCAQTPFVKCLPVEVAEPRVVLDLGRSRVAQPVLRLALYHLVDEVSCLNTPARRNILHLYFNLLRHDMFADLFPALADVWTLAVHAFICHDSDGEVVDCLRVIETQHDLRRHVARCS